MEVGACHSILFCCSGALAGIRNTNKSSTVELNWLSNITNEKFPQKFIWTAQYATACLHFQTKEITFLFCFFSFVFCFLFWLFIFKVEACVTVTSPFSQLHINKLTGGMVPISGLNIYVFGLEWLTDLLCPTERKKSYICVKKVKNRFLPMHMINLCCWSLFVILPWGWMNIWK